MTALFPALSLCDAQWMSDRVADTGRRWDCSDSRVNGTLWWYSASSTLVAPRIGALVAGTAIPDPDLSVAHCFLRDDGYFGGIVTESTVDACEIAGLLTAALAPVIDVLAEVSGATVRALWAITTDSIANRALDVDPFAETVSDCVARERASSVATELVAQMRELGAPMPAPRFVDVDDRLGRIRYTRRSSCCLIYETPGSGKKCMSCPRQPPHVRHERLVSRRG